MKRRGETDGRIEIGHRGRAQWMKEKEWEKKKKGLGFKSRNREILRLLSFWIESKCSCHCHLMQNPVMVERRRNTKRK